MDQSGIRRFFTIFFFFIEMKTPNVLVFDASLPYSNWRCLILIKKIFSVCAIDWNYSRWHKIKMSTVKHNHFNLEFYKLLTTLNILIFILICFYYYQIRMINQNWCHTQSDFAFIYDLIEHWSCQIDIEYNLI